MIKRISLSLILCFCLSLANGQTTADWQTDLRYLQQTVHSKYNNLFHTISKPDWDREVDEFYKEIPSLAKEQVLAGFVHLLALFQVGHTLMNVFELQQGSTAIQLNRLPYGLYAFSDGVYILMAADQYQKAVGGKVLKIGNLTVEEALEAIRPLVSYENEQGFRNKCMYYLTIPEFLKTQGITTSSSQVPITWVKNGKEETTVFTAGANPNDYYTTGLETPAGWTVAKKSGDPPLWQKEPSSFRYMQYLPKTKTLYVRHSITDEDGNKTIADFFASVVKFIDNNNVVKLILDVRTNEGGDNYLNKPIITGIIKSRKINQKGKFFCIIGRKTFSASQNLVNELEKYTDVIFVGEPTSENVNFFADVRTEILPATKLKAQLSWLWWQNMDPRDKRKATSPALAVDMRFSDYYNNLDPVMTTIDNYTSKQGPVDDQLTLLLLYGKYDEVVKLAAEYIKDPLHRYYKNELEEKINAYGYTLISNYRLTDANHVLAINVQLFPESANAYYSYGESFMLLGKREEALTYFGLAVEKDKRGTTADQSRRMIRKLSGHD